MGYPKPLLMADGETFAARLAGLMLGVVARLIVVLGAYDAEVRAVLPQDSRITVVRNSDYHAGQLSSLKCGLAAVSADAQAVMVHLIDHPLVRRGTFESTCQAFLRHRAPITIARCAGKRGHPVIFARGVFSELTQAPLDAGARVVVNRDPARVFYVDVDDPGVSMDLDTPEDVARAGLAAPPHKSGA